MNANLSSQMWSPLYKINTLNINKEINGANIYNRRNNKHDNVCTYYIEHHRWPWDYTINYN